MMMMMMRQQAAATSWFILWSVRKTHESYIAWSAVAGVNQGQSQRGGGSGGTGQL